MESQGKILMHPGVMDIVFHSGDAIKLSVEVSAVLRS